MGFISQIYQHLGRIVQILEITLVKLFWFIFSFFVPKKEGLWVFNSGVGDRFTGNSKYFFLYCQSIDQIQNVWITRDPEIVTNLRKNGYEAYTENSLRGKYMLLRSKASFNTHGEIYWEYLNRSTLIFLHHGNALKHMGEDASNFIPFNHIGKTIFNRKFLVTSMGEPYNVFSSAYNLSKSEAIVGAYPRLDVFYTEVEGEEIGINSVQLGRLKEKAKEAQLVVYLPTWRPNDFQNDSIKKFLQEYTLNELNSLLKKNNCELYISLHPTRGGEQPEYSNYDNINKLDTGGDIYPFLRHFDILITDYSSVFYDYLLSGNPMLFFSPDLEEYKGHRGLYFEYQNHVPGPIIKDIPSLLRDLEITINDQTEFSNHRKKLLEEYYLDIHKKPSAQVFDSVIENID